MNEKLRMIVAEMLELDPALITSETSAENQPKWDSLRHMNLIFAIEDAFGIRFDDAELPKMTSIAAIEHVLGK